MAGNEKTLYIEICQDKKAKEKLTKGINLVADIIKTTLGPKGRNVIVKETPYFKPRSKNDGHYIARGIKHKDHTINAGCDLMKENCANTNDRVGDGTSSTAKLSQVIIQEGFKEIESGKNPVDIKRELNEDLKNILEHLNKISKPLKTMDEIEHVATISGNNDKDIGQAIRQVKEQIGREAAIITERHDKNEIKVKCVKGIYFKEGYGKKKAFISNQRKGLCEMEGTEDDPVYILCYDSELSDINELNTFLTKIGKILDEKQTAINFKLLIITKIADENSLPVNFLAGQNKDKLEGKVEQHQTPEGIKNIAVGFRNAAIESPRCVGYQPDVLEDIALATGGILVGDKSANRLRDVDPLLVLGKAKSVTISMDETMIIGGFGDQQKIKAHLDGLEKELKELTKDNEREAMQNRIDILGSGIGILKVGGITKPEAKDRELRVEDAKLATKAAIAEGISVGGGNTYYQLSKIAKTNILKKACLSIPEQIAKNTGVKFDKIKTKDNFGFNALTGKYNNLIEAGVIDATKVIRVSLENAVSFGGMILTTDSTIIAYEE